MSLVKSKELFLDRGIPLMADDVADRSLIQSNLHRHEYFEMLFVERGTLINRFKTRELVMKPGDLVIMKPYVLHVLECPEDSGPVTAYCCSFLPQAVDGTIQSLEELLVSQSPNKYYFQSFLALASNDVSAVTLKLPNARRGEVAEVFQLLRKLTHEDTDSATAWSRNAFLRLLGYLADESPRQEPNEASGQGSNSVVSASRYQAGLRTALSCIHDRYQQPLKLKDVAAMSGSSVTYFCRLFKHETGMTFREYVNSLRIERACVLLRETSENAMNICYEVGYNDYSHFSRQFKKRTGVSVTQYRIDHQVA